MSAKVTWGQWAKNLPSVSLDKFLTAINVSNEKKDIVKYKIKKIINFINRYKSLLFFGLTIAFSLWMAPLGTLAIYSSWGTGVRHLVLTGISIGAGALLLANFIGKGNISYTYNDKINTLLGVINICASILSPEVGAFKALQSIGVVGIKDAYRYCFEM